MSLILVNFSIVVVAQHHNPSILSPDFLARHEIVPDEWNWELSGEVFSTPPLAQVPYTSGVSVICEQTKLQFVDSSRHPDTETSRIGSMAARYLEVLPHVPYTGVGINFTGVVEHPTPSKELIERFLKTGPWTSAENPLQDVGLRLFYPLMDGRLRLSFESGSYTPRTGSGAPDNKPKPGILVGANFHHDLPKADPVSAAKRVIDRSNEYSQRFSGLITSIVDSPIEMSS